MDHDILIRAYSLNATIAQFNYLRAAFQGSQSVGDNEDGEVSAKAFDGLHDALVASSKIRMLACL